MDVNLEAKAIPQPLNRGQRQRVALRQAKRLHELRTQGYFLRWEDNFERPKACAGCGGELNEHTKGCKQCSDRLGKRRKRAMTDNRDPQLLGEWLLKNKNPDETLSQTYDRLHESAYLQDFLNMHASTNGATQVSRGG